MSESKEDNSNHSSNTKEKAMDSAGEPINPFLYQSSDESSDSLGNSDDYISDHDEEGDPVVLISAEDLATAEQFAKDIISGTEQLSAVDKASVSEEPLYWTIKNKYYTTTVRLLPHASPAGDDNPDEEIPYCEAHIVLLSEKECKDGAVLEKRARGGRGEVRLAVWRGEGEGGASDLLRGVAAGMQYELVSAEPDPDEDDSEECSGLRRVRSALHAHVWAGVGGAGGDWRDLRELDLWAAVDAVRALAGGERRRRAGELVAALWRGVGGDERDL